MKINLTFIDNLFTIVIAIALIVFMIIAANAGHWTEAIFWLLVYSFSALGRTLEKMGKS